MLLAQVHLFYLDLRFRSRTLNILGPGLTSSSRKTKRRTYNFSALSNFLPSVMYNTYGSFSKK